MVTINQELISKEDQELMDKMNDLEGKIIMLCHVMNYGINQNGFVRRF